MGDIHNLVREHGPAKARELVREEERRLIDIAAEILDAEGSDISYLYSGFAMISFPYRPLSSVDDIWERKNGPYTLIVEPGLIPEPTGARKYGVPYGSRARMIMFYLQTQAVQQGSRVVALGRSMNDWMQRMGIEGRGGWNIKQIRDQAMRISACHMTVGFQTESGANGFMRRNVVSSMISLPPARQPRQGWMFDQTAELSEDFYRHLRDHPLPVQEAAIKIIGNSAMTIDVYVWLAYRLRKIGKPTLVRRDALHAQFGSMYNQPRQFWVHFKKALGEAMAVYPEAKVDLLKDGLRLTPSPPPVPARTMVPGGLVLPLRASLATPGKPEPQPKLIGLERD